jgi:hypothetical protein
MSNLVSIARLIEVLPTLSANSQSFARSLIEQSGRRALSDKQMFYVNKMIADAAKPQAAPTAQVGCTSAIMNWFKGIKAKAPSVVLVLESHVNPATGAVVVDEEMKVSRYSAASKNAGQLKVASHTHFEDGLYGPQGRWYGTVALDGTYTPARKHGDRSPLIAATMAAFAADPAGVAARDGKAMGRCCFCYLPLTQGDSLEVGYGKKCASNHGLPWGAKAVKAAALMCEAA